MVSSMGRHDTRVHPMSDPRATQERPKTPPKAAKSGPHARKPTTPPESTRCQPIPHQLIDLVQSYRSVPKSCWLTKYKESYGVHKLLWAANVHKFCTSAFALVDPRITLIVTTTLLFMYVNEGKMVVTVYVFSRF